MIKLGLRVDEAKAEMAEAFAGKQEHLDKLHKGGGDLLPNEFAITS